MSTNAYPFRRRIIGRAASPPTWACYEQIPCDDDEDSDDVSDDMSCSEDGEDYSARDGDDAPSDSELDHHVVNTTESHELGDVQNMEIDGTADGGHIDEKNSADYRKDVKGKQRAIEPEPIKRHRKKQRPVYTLRPILTIQRSQGFVWNQDLFVPPYIKDRYVASTSPPDSRGFISTSASTNSSFSDYEVEVVEIRVREGELNDIIP